MKTVNASSFFKKVSEKAENPRAGQKRPNLSWTFQVPEASEIAELDSGKVAKVLESFVESYGRKVIAQNGDDWNFVPAGIDFDSAYLDLVSEVSKSRLVTKESLKALGEFYKVQAVKVLGVSLPAAATGAIVIAERFKAIAGKNDVLKVMEARLMSLVEQCEEDEILPFVELIEALMKELQDLQEIKVTEDML